MSFANRRRFGAAKCQKNQNDSRRVKGEIWLYFDIVVVVLSNLYGMFITSRACILYDDKTLMTMIMIDDDYNKNIIIVIHVRHTTFVDHQFPLNASRNADIHSLEYVFAFVPRAISEAGDCYYFHPSLQLAYDHRHFSVYS